VERLRRLAWRVQRAVNRPAPSVFFLRGHPRSGTNWLGALLNLHPRIWCTGEFHLDSIRDTIRRLQAQAWHLVGREPVRHVLDSWLDELVRRCLAESCSKDEATHVGDRTPHPLPDDGHPMVAGAPTILLVRDGRDVLVSWRFHLLWQGAEVADLVVPREYRERFNADAEEFRRDPRAFSESPERLLADEGWVRFASERWARWVTHDAGVLNRLAGAEQAPRVHVIRYEDLHADVERERARMYEFLGVNPADAAPVSAETKTSAGFGREDNRSFFRHGAVGDWRTYAVGDVKRWIREAAGAALVELGYERDTSW
jgi:Sulfotransferase domain